MTSTKNVAVLPRRTVVLYSFGSLGTGGFATLPGLVLVYYLTDTLGVAAALAGVTITVAKIWDVVIDPIIGGLSDRSFAHTGSRRRGMLLGALTLPIFFTLTFAAPAGMPPLLSALWVAVAFVLAATAFSAFQVPYIALPAEIATGYDDRTRLLTWRVVVLTIAILLFGAGGPELRGMFPGNPHLGYFVMALVAGLVIGAGFFIASKTAPKSIPTGVRGPINVASFYRDALTVLRQSQPFRALLGAFMLQALAVGLMLAGAQYLATWILHSEGAVTILFASLIAPALLVAPLWQLVAKRVGKERGFVLASSLFLLATLALVAMLLVPGWWIVVPVALAGAAYAGMQSLPMAMLPDIIKFDSDRTKADRAGMFGAVWTAGETMGAAFGATLLTIVLATTGYIETTAATVLAEQPETARIGIILSFSAAPALMMVLSLLVFRRYRLRRIDFEPGFDLEPSEEQS